MLRSTQFDRYDDSVHVVFGDLDVAGGQKLEAELKG
jgi:hypothetical protein